MNKSLNVNKILEHVKQICDANRCIICDTLDGSQVRHTDGQPVCYKCFTEDKLYPSQLHKTTAGPKLFDAVLTQRASNAKLLLETCQEVFHTDVYKRHRLSEQLKVEKELFPDCIQAPAKYCNKRKSFNSSIYSKENKKVSYLPGEEVSFVRRTMENSANFVLDWLNKNERNLARKPFTDLCTNKRVEDSLPYSRKRGKFISKSSKENSSKQLNTKAKRNLKSIKINQITLKQKSLCQNVIPLSEEPCIKKRREDEHLENYNHSSKNSMNNESGIVIDDDTIVIEDSQSQVIDKDREAWLAVLAADQDTHDSCQTSLRLDCSENVNNTIEVDKTLMRPEEEVMENNAKVPFYKKGLILETCPQCLNKSDIIMNTSKSDDISIMVESESFITTIKVYKVHEHDKDYQSSVTQTEKDEVKTFCAEDEVEEAGKQNDKKHIPHEKPNRDQNEISQDIFTGAIKPGIVIEDSDSDLEESGTVQVTADIHRSCDQLDYNVLTEVVDQREHGSRPRRAARGLTPTSTDSSEKENFNPNRIKKTKPGKKPKK